MEDRGRVRLFDVKATVMDGWKIKKGSYVREVCVGRRWIFWLERGKFLVMSS
jgi:hypothetical protein